MQHAAMNPVQDRIVWDVSYQMSFHDRLFTQVQPADDQHWGSCVARATAGMIEVAAKLRGQDLGRSQLDALRLYKHAREMFWPGEQWNAGGLFLDQAFVAAVDMGLLPSNAALRSITYGFEEMDELFEEHAFLAGFVVHDGWMKPDKDDGEIREGLKLYPWSGQHAVLLVGTQVQRGRFWIVFQNSWGEDWGRYGFGIISAVDFERTILPEGPYYLDIPEGTDWKIDEKFLVA